MSTRRLPPLRALNVFEAAGRCGSFRQAADELGITRSAVSHQIKSLEAHLGFDLFRRDTRRAELTTMGQIYLPAIREAFDRIEEQTEALIPAASATELTLQVYVTVALKWLLPRLHDFERQYPDLKVRLWTSYFDWDFDAGNVDAGLLLVRNPNPLLHERDLFQSVLTPVCSPNLLEGPHGLRSPADLRHHKLLHVFSAEEDWRRWLGAAGVGGIELFDRLAFDSYILAQEAAIEGRGVAMTIGPFARDELASGRLVEPFPLRVPHRHVWKFVCEKPHALKPKIRKLENWLIEQVEADIGLDVPHMPIASGRQEQVSGS